MFLTIHALDTTVFALQNEDSVNISEQMRLALQDHPDDIIIKWYGCAFMHYFAEGKPVSEMLNDKTLNGDESAIYMIFSSETDQVIYKRYTQNGVYRIDRNFVRCAEWDRLYPYIEDPSKVLGKSITVTNIYCLNGEDSLDGVYIYYVTDQGDYVLYKEYLLADDMYLFPAEDFYAFAKVVYEERISSSRGPNGEPLYGGGKSIKEIYNMKPYKVADHSRIVWIAVILVISSIVAVVFIRKYRVTHDVQAAKIAK